MSRKTLKVCDAPREAPMADSLLTAAQAASYLAVSESSIHWLCRTRQVRYAVIAGKRRFVKQDLDAYVQKQLVEAI